MRWGLLVSLPYAPKINIARVTKRRFSRLLKYSTGKSNALPG